MVKRFKTSLNRMLPSRDRNSSGRQHHAADAQEASAVTPTEMEPHTPSLNRIEKYFPNGNTLGLHVLHSPDDARVDIIFIHGLMGDAYRTWTDDVANVYWPVNLLGTANDDARIVAFGYDCKVVSLFSRPVGQNTLRGHADSLLGQIGNLRPDSSEASKRKIILIVHSLGGLVAKKALCISAQSPHAHLRQLHDNIHGILFLGTPHRGSDLAPNAKRLAKLFKYFGGAAVNPGILEPLLRDSPILEEVENDFGNWLKRKGKFEHITCFYEELEVPGVGFIVSKESATISGTPGPYSIHANHMQMSKFASSDSPGFKQVYGELRRWIAAIEEEPQLVFEQSEIHSLLRSLAYPEMDSRIQSVPSATPGTCLWVFDSSAYNDFLRNGGLLGIKGKPGSGKSTILREISSKFQKASDTADDIVVSFFFSGGGSDLQRSKLGLYRSLLHQLCQSFPQLWSEMTKVFVDQSRKRGPVGKAWNWSERQLSDALMDHLGSRPLPRRTWIFLDALDEAGEENAKKVIEFLKDLLSASKERNTPGSPTLGVCYTCRHYPIIRAGTDLEICLEDWNGLDIMTHSRTTLVKWGLKSIEVDDLCAFIGEKANGIFLWVQLVLEQIDKHHLTKTFAHVRQKVMESPPELTQMYKAKLETVSHQDRPQSLAILQWICFAREPLSLDTLRVALVLHSSLSGEGLQQCFKADDYIADDELLVNVVLDLTRGLAQVSNSGQKTVKFIHQSVRDFVESGAGQLGITCGSSNHQMFQSCLEGISFLEKARLSIKRTSGYLGPRDSKAKYDLVQRQIPPLLEDLEIPYPWKKFINQLKGRLTAESVLACESFLRYATKYWYQHMVAAQTEPGLEQSMIHALDTLPENGLCVHWFGIHRIVAVQHNPFSIIHCYVYQPVKDRVSLHHVLAALGLLDELKLVIDSRGLPIEPQESTMLHWAAINCQERVTEWLLTLKPIDPNKQGHLDRTPLDWLFDSMFANNFPFEKVVATLEKFVEAPHVDWDVKRSDGLSLLCDVVRRHRHEVLRAILRRKEIGITHYDYEDWSLLDLAICENSEESLRILIATGLERLQSGSKTPLVKHDVNTLSADFTEFFWNCRKLWTRSSIYVALCQKGGRKTLEILPGEETTVLHFAAQEGKTDLCQFLVASEFKVGVKDMFRREPLHCAAESGHMCVVKLLLNAGSNPESRDVYGLSPTHLAVIKGYFDIARTLAEELEKADRHCMTPFFYAILDNNEDVAYKRCLDDAECHQRPDHYVSPTLLQRAAKTGNFKMVKASIRPSDPDAADGFKVSLCKAAEEGHLAVVNLLLDHGAQIGSDIFGMTPLHYAARMGHAELLTALLDRGADVVLNQQDKLRMQTPLHHAVSCRQEDTVQALIKHGADLNLQDDRGLTPLHVAVRHGQEDKVRELIKYGADTNMKTGRKETPLHYAAMCGHEAVVKVLLEYGSDTNVKDWLGKTPLHHAGDYPQVIRQLIDHGADRNAEDRQGRTPLHDAVDGGCNALVRELLEHGVDEKLKNDQKITPQEVSEEHRYGVDDSSDEEV